MERVDGGVRHSKTEKIMTFFIDPSTMAVALLAGIVSLLVLRQYFKGNAQQFCLPPGPLGLPLVGMLPFLGKNLHRHFAGLARSYGPVFSLRLGSKICVVVTSPSAVREIFKDQDAAFANRDIPAAIQFCLGATPELLWSHYGPQYRMLRKLAASHVLNPASIENAAPARRREVRRAVAAVWEQAKIGSEVDVREVIFKTALDTTTSILWGERVSDGDRAGARFWEAVEAVIDLMLRPNVADFYPAMARFDPQGLGRRLRQRLECVHSYLGEIVERKKKELEGGGGGGGAESKDVVTTLLKLMLGRDPQLATFTQFDLRNFILNMIAASTESKATTIEWALAELLKHPYQMTKAQQELDAIVTRDRVVEESDIPKLRYLAAVLKETLRLHPPLPLLLPHRPSTRCTVGGFSIPADSAVLVNIWAIQRDPLIWKDPEEFEPERFLEEGTDQKFDYKGGNEFNYLPFGAGRRGCPGILLAERMIVYSLASLLHSFDWRLQVGAEKSVLSERLGFVLRKAESLVAVPELRLSKPELYG